MAVKNRQSGLMLLIIVGLFIACKLNNQVNSEPDQATRTPQPTFTSYPVEPLIGMIPEQGRYTSVSPIIIPTATPTKTRPIVCPTLMLPPPTPVRTPSYNEDILRETSQLVYGSRNLLEQVRKAEPGNPNWVSGMIISSDYIQSSYQYLTGLEVPTEQEDEYRLLMEAVGECREATDKVKGDWHTCWIEEDDLREAEQLLGICLGKVRELEKTIGVEIE